MLVSKIKFDDYSLIRRIFYFKSATNM